jgi:hypothetical protein
LFSYFHKDLKGSFYDEVQDKNKDIDPGKSFRHPLSHGRYGDIEKIQYKSKNILSLLHYNILSDYFPYPNGKKTGKGKEE